MTDQVNKDSDIYVQKLARKIEDKLYRAAAARLSGGKVGEETSVSRSEGGAFVEAIIWVPDEEIRKP